MRYFDQSFSDPVVVLPAQLPHQPAFIMNPTRPSLASPLSNNGIRQTPAGSIRSTPTQCTPRSAAGRKRSRDEAASNLEEDYFQMASALPEPENEDEWEYGEGMVLIKKGTGYVTDSTSQTGTWQEEKVAEEQAKMAALVAAAADRPVLRANKSQRLNLSATPAISEDKTVICDDPSPGGSPERQTEPTVDMFTLHLGIGWSSMDNAGPDIQAASRGWAKFIENNFPITGVKIQLQSKGLSSYLVEACEGYFLFGEDLKQGRLVSTSLEKTFANLREPVPVFDGELVMEAGQTLKVVETGITQSFANDDTMFGTYLASDNGSQAPNELTAGVNAPSSNGGHGEATNGIADGLGGSDLNRVRQQPQTVEVEMDMS